MGTCKVVPVLQLAEWERMAKDNDANAVRELAKYYKEVGNHGLERAYIDKGVELVEPYCQYMDVVYKAAEFVNFCDAFCIPVLTLTNVTGYAATMNEAKNINIAAAKLTYAFANATVPKVNVVIKKAFGSAYVTMNSKSTGADYVFALEDSEIGAMEASLAAQIIYSSEIERVPCQDICL